MSYAVITFILSLYLTSDVTSGPRQVVVRAIPEQTLIMSGDRVKQDGAASGLDLTKLSYVIRP